MGPSPLLGLILAGGLSRRMGGRDKVLLPLAGRTLLEHVAQRLAPQCPGGLVLSANGDPARFARVFSGPILPDGLPGNPGPLAGILAALDHCADRRPDVADVLSAPADVPFLPEDLAVRLAEARAREGTATAVAASGSGQHHTVALWPVALRHALRRALVEEGERRVGAFLASVGTARADWSGRGPDPFVNVNTPEDLAAVQGLAPGPGWPARR